MAAESPEAAEPMETGDVETPKTLPYPSGHKITVQVFERWGRICEDPMADYVSDDEAG